MISKTNIIVKKAFSIIEVMIGIFIFTLGLVAIYALLISSLNLSEYNKNAIIASQLAVEQIEIIRNIRDTNYKTLQAWDNIPWLASKNISEGYFTVENNISTGGYNIQAISGFKEGKEYVNDMQVYRLYLTADTNQYTYSTTNTSETNFYRYLYIEEISQDTYLLRSRVIWNVRWYHDYDIETIITDWRRL